MDLGKEDTSGRMNRRTALATIVGGALTIWDRLQGRSIVPQSQAEPPKIFPTPLPTAPATSIPRVEQPVTPELPSSVRDIFRNCTPAELTIAAQWVEKERSHLNSQEQNEDCIDRTWSWKGSIDEVASSLTINREVVPWIMPLIFAESRGDATAVSPKSGAKGLCQIMPNTLLHLKQYLGLTKEPDLFDGKENIRLGTEYLDYLYKLIPDPSLALWSYHLGIGNMIKAIGFYHGVDTTPLIQDLNKRDTAKQAQEKLRNFIVNSQGGILNLVKMLTTPRVVEGLQKADAFHDNTHLYVPRIAAASTYFPVRG